MLEIEPQGQPSLLEQTPSPEISNTAEFFELARNGMSQYSALLKATQEQRLFEDRDNLLSDQHQQLDLLRRLVDTGSLLAGESNIVDEPHDLDGNFPFPLLLQIHYTSLDLESHTPPQASDEISIGLINGTGNVTDGLTFQDLPHIMKAIDYQLYRMFYQYNEAFESEYGPQIRLAVAKEMFKIIFLARDNASAIDQHLDQSIQEELQRKEEHQQEQKITSKWVRKERANLRKIHDKLVRINTREIYRERFARNTSNTANGESDTPGQLKRIKMQLLDFLQQTSSYSYPSPSETTPTLEEVKELYNEALDLFIQRKPRLRPYATSIGSQYLTEAQIAERRLINLRQKRKQPVLTWHLGKVENSHHQGAEIVFKFNRATKLFYIACRNAPQVDGERNTNSILTINSPEELADYFDNSVLAFSSLHRLIYALDNNGISVTLPHFSLEQISSLLDSEILHKRKMHTLANLLIHAYNSVDQKSKDYALKIITQKFHVEDFSDSTELSEKLLLNYALRDDELLQNSLLYVFQNLTMNGCPASPRVLQETVDFIAPQEFAQQSFIRKGDYYILPDADGLLRVCKITYSPEIEADEDDMDLLLKEGVLLKTFGRLKQFPSEFKIEAISYSISSKPEIDGQYTAYIPTQNLSIVCTVIENGRKAQKTIQLRRPLTENERMAYADMVGLQKVFKGK